MLSNCHYDIQSNLLHAVSQQDGAAHNANEDMYS